MMKQQIVVSSAARRRGLITILIDTFLMWAGFFMVIPLISVHFVDGLGWSAAVIGLVLAVRQITQQGLTVLGGMMADRLGTKWLICAGMLIRSASFGGMAWADSFPLLLVTTFLAAVGGALFDSPQAATVVALTEPAQRARVYSLQGVLSGLGMTTGPLIGALLLRFSFGLVALGAAACFALAFLVTLLLLPPVQVAGERQQLTYGIRLALRDRPFVLFNLLLMGYWFMWVQLSISLPLEAKAISGTADAVSWVYLINAGMSVVLQYPLLRLLERRYSQMSILIHGMIIMAIGLGAVALARTVPGLLLCVIVFSLGALLAMPSQQTVKAELANPTALGSFLGVSSLALALGGGLGNYSGGLLYGLGGTLDLPALPWFVFSATGLAAAGGLALLQRWAVRGEATSQACPELVEGSQEAG
jgi:DHA1 family multidrug resistance protein-like MFS transporter